DIGAGAAPPFIITLYHRMNFRRCGPGRAPRRAAVRSRRAGRPAFAPGRGAVRLRSGRGGPGRAALLSESATFERPEGAYDILKDASPSLLSIEGGINHGQSSQGPAGPVLLRRTAARGPAAHRVGRQRVRRPRREAD